MTAKCGKCRKKWNISIRQSVRNYICPDCADCKVQKRLDKLKERMGE